MTGRERFRAAFSFGEADRVPLFEQSVTSSVASAVLGRAALTGGAGLHWHEAAAHMDGTHDAFVARVARDFADFARETGMDAVSVPWLRGRRPSARPDENTFVYEDASAGTRETWRFDPSSQTFGRASREGRTPSVAEQVEAAERALAESPPRPEDFVRSKVFYEAGGRDLAWVGKAGFISIPMDAPWLEATLLEPELIARWLDVQLETGLRGLEIEKALGADAVWAGGDCCTNAGPVYSPATFRELMLPRLRRLVGKCEELGLWYLFRTDGMTLPIAPLLFEEAGCHGYGEIDQEAGMDLAALRERFPRLVLWGGVPCGTVLHRGTPEEVRARARKAVADAHRGGGLVLGSSNTVMHGTPVENVRALAEAARGSRW